MRKRTLGRTGFEISEIGFGAWGLSGQMWLGVAEDESLAALHAALDLGVDFIDTALAYGDGVSEQRISRVLAERARHPKSPGGASGSVNTGSSDLVIATKIPPMNRVWPAGPKTGIDQVYPARHVIECVEASLRNLRIEAIPIEQFHVWHDAWLDAPSPGASSGWHETREAMERLTDAGKVLHWGVSVNDHAPETALRIIQDPLIETAQVIYNIYDQTPEDELFPLARKFGAGIINRVPFDEGALTGTIGPKTKFERGDWRDRYFHGSRKAEVEQHALSLEELLLAPQTAPGATGGSAAHAVRTLPELALRFCLSNYDVSTVIPGMRHAEHARRNAAVSDGRHLSDALRDTLRGHAWNKNWYA